MHDLGWREKVAGRNKTPWARRYLSRPCSRNQNCSLIIRPAGPSLNRGFTTGSRSQYHTSSGRPALNRAANARRPAPRTARHLSAIRQARSNAEVPYPVRSPVRSHEIRPAYGERVEVALAVTAARQAVQQAFTDPLTGLGNRRRLLDRLQHELVRADRGGEPPTVLFIDLDRFKLVNDSLGHLVGDQLLIAVAERLRGCVRDADTCVRVGRDEFAVLLAQGSDAAALAKRIIDTLKARFQITERRGVHRRQRRDRHRPRGRRDAATQRRRRDVSRKARRQRPLSTL